MGRHSAVMEKPNQPEPCMFEVQLGKFDVRIMNQSTFWINREAHILRIDDMSTDHITNVITMLEENPRRYHLAALVDAMINIAEAMFDGRPSGEVLAYELTGENPGDIPAEEWLAATPLMRHLRRPLEERRNAASS